jgi:hypothetical protein
MGMKDAARNRPFLSTGEMFRLKLADNGAFVGRFDALSEKERRKLVEGDVARVPLDAISEVAWPKPRALEIEWLASASDLVRAMDWLRRKTDSGAAAPLRSVLAINPGLDLSKAHFAYLGYKGGSEPGVLDMTYLVQTQAGTWYALSAAWNDPAAALDETRFFGLMQRALELIAER